MNRPVELREYRWLVAPELPAGSPLEASALSETTHPVLRQILYNRGLVDPAHAQAFLENRYLESRDPFLLADMDKAVERIIRAIGAEEQIVVYGDFDADGVTSTVLLVEALRGLVADRRLVVPYIPDRVDEGYGLNLEALSSLRESNATLAISVDCGIRSPTEVAHAQSIGLDMIITDHHSLGRDLPPAVAVINPKRGDSGYPERMLAGVGIAYKLAVALRQAMPERAQFDTDQFLDLVSLGTVADLAPLLGENRKLVAEGLGVLNEVRRPGIAALMNVSGLEAGQITAESIGFGLAPRVNAAGRLAHAYDAARLLITTNHRQAQEQARKLDSLNRERQSLTRTLGAHAESLVDPQAPIIIAADPAFKSGIVGLVASRLAEKNYRPAIVLEQGESESRGSCRSIPEFHITHALDEVSDLLERHGGHAQAAGFTIRNEHLPAFVERMTQLATDQLSGADLRPSLEIDAELDMNEIDWALQETLVQLEPTGHQNASPVFVSKRAEVISHRQVGHDGAHLQMTLAGGRPDGDSATRAVRTFPAIAFRQGDWAAGLPQFVDIVYRIGVNRWQGNTSLQLRVEDIRPSE